MLHPRALNSEQSEKKYIVVYIFYEGLAIVYWSGFWLAQQEVRGLIPGLTATISDTSYPLLPNRDVVEIKRRNT